MEISLCKIMKVNKITHRIKSWIEEDDAEENIPVVCYVFGMDRDGDFLGKYKIISNKLKKRFLKKPNVSEGSEQFASLSKTLKNQECPQYAAFCCLAQARCEHTLANSPGEAEALTQAARNFLDAEKQYEEIKCPSFQEHLNAAINCYSHAIRVHIENRQPALAAALCLELGNALKGLNRPGEATQHYLRAAELQSQNSLDCLTSLGFVASCRIQTKDYQGALSVMAEMTQIIQDGCGALNGGKPAGIFSDILANCEITRVLLLMLLQPTPQRIRPENAQTLEKYAWEIKEEGIAVEYISEDLFLLMQSVVMACQSRDMDSLKALQVELWPVLTVEQNELLHLVIHELGHPSGEGI